jgi:hypothetical protein
MTQVRNPRWNITNRKRRRNWEEFSGKNLPLKLVC